MFEKVCNFKIRLYICAIKQDKKNENDYNKPTSNQPN